MTRWIRTASVGEVPPGTAQEVVAEDRIIALFNSEGGFFALDGICPHQGGPLAKGKLNGCVVTCPWHGWQFDVRNGRHQINALIQHQSFPVKVENGYVWVDLDG